jgi:hypothetical protein
METPTRPNDAAGTASMINAIKSMRTQVHERTISIFDLLLGSFPSARIA